MIGGFSCWAWIQARQQHRQAYQLWVAGFLSDLNSESDPSRDPPGRNRLRWHRGLDRQLLSREPSKVHYEKAMEVKSAQQGLVLTEAQGLEKAKTEKEAHGESESEDPGTAGPRIRSSRQPEGCWTHLALRPQDAHHGGDLLNCCCFFEDHDVKLLRVLTDRGSELIPNGASTSSISRSRTSITRAPGPRARRRTASDAWRPTGA
jgi:hypothetical protein